MAKSMGSTKTAGQDCSHTRTRAIGARKSEPDATLENVAPASSETFRPGNRA
jgi:hypothetical protein